MSKIVWDEQGKRRIEAGVSKGVLYVMNGTTYAKGVAWNGLTSVSESPDGGDLTDLWADGIKYASLRAAENYGGTIEAYTYPDEFEQCDGAANIGGATSGVIIGQQTRKPFGFCWRTEIGSDTHTSMDEGYKLHIVYNASASPSERSYETINDSPDAITFSWEFKATAVPVPDTAGSNLKATCVLTIDSTKCTKMTELENVLYGTETQEPKLPTIAEILAIING